MTRIQKWIVSGIGIAFFLYGLHLIEIINENAPHLAWLNLILLVYVVIAASGAAAFAAWFMKQKN